jgi:ABC-type branched-subunit amino acid transport system substrate-binding protein
VAPHRSTLLWLLISAALPSCASKPSPGKVLRVVVVGNTVPNTYSLMLTQPRERGFPRDDAKGAAIWTAAKLAFDAGVFSIVPKASAGTEITLEGVDDWGDPSFASAIAEALARDPTVLAVIGSTASSTSRAMGPILSASGVPLLMPIATSPDAITDPNSGARLEYVVRLPPSDERVQAPSVSAFATRRLRAFRIALVRDSDPSTQTYSIPLCDRIADQLGDVTHETFELLSSDGADGVASVIDGGSYDTVIFCGYVSGGEQLLASLERFYRGRLDRAPKVILTDGALDKRLRPRGLQAYLTFPLPPIDSLVPKDQPSAQLIELIRGGGADSYEIYAFDAIRMLGAAAEQCLGRLSRSCLFTNLSLIQPYTGVAFPYTFINGENSSAKYYVYRLEDSAPGATPFVLEAILDAADIATAGASRP